MLRAAPKNALGLCNEAGSSPPDNVRPLGGMTRLYARAKRVMESISIITSSPISTNRFARSNNNSATLTWCSGGSSKVEWTTSADSTDLSISVTSSGRSPTSKINKFASGLLLAIALAISFNKLVLPALGGATIRPR